MTLKSLRALLIFASMVALIVAYRFLTQYTARGLFARTTGKGLKAVFLWESMAR